MSAEEIFEHEIQYGFRVGTYIQTWRNQKNISLRKFAEMVELSPTFISLLERGLQDPPSEAKLRQIAQVIGLDEDEMLAAAGRSSEEWKQTIASYPQEIANFMKVAHQLHREQWGKMTKYAHKLIEKDR